MERGDEANKPNMAAIDQKQARVWSVASRRLLRLRHLHQTAAGAMLRYKTFCRPTQCVAANEVFETFEDLSIGNRELS